MKQLEIAVLAAREQHVEALNQLEHSKRMAHRGYITMLELQRAEIRAERAAAELELKQKLEVQYRDSMRRRGVSGPRADFETTAPDPTTGDVTYEWPRGSAPMPLKSPTDSRRGPAQNATGSSNSPTTAVDREATDLREQLRYDGKTFDIWRSSWRTELKAELRIEALLALGAFGVNGYADEATETVLDVMQHYDQTDPPQKTGSRRPKKPSSEDQQIIAAALATLLPDLLRRWRTKIKASAALRPEYSPNAGGMREKQLQIWHEL